jgi:uncharacterized protein DUF4365
VGLLTSEARKNNADRRCLGAGAPVTAARKRRTRKHIIADMSFYCLGYLIVRCGFTFEANQRADYGYDGSVFTFDAQGQIENSYIFIQLKATDNIKMSHDKNGNYALDLANGA